MSEAAEDRASQAPKERKLSDAIPLEAVHRIAKIPVVESSMNIASDVYSRVKESNSMINWTLSTAENTVSKAVEHAIPVAEKMEKHLKRVDSILCSSLDYVEAKVPAVKLPPHEIYENTHKLVESKLQPALERASELKQKGAEKVRSLARESSTTTQLVSIAASSVEAAQRYMHTASAHLANGEDERVHTNGHGGEGLPAVEAGHRHPIYNPQQPQGDAAAVPAAAAPNSVSEDTDSDNSPRKPKRRH
ncbi:lipid storage droplets surface-binding protein 2-like isoform X4 [Cloeon dipterum]|uniref:lipid storage droplets surface-binding protein 2-like isoform X4 n=1 Tax=Cloeon dipterum TaxID=197152 RepID=UPI00321FE2FF